MTNKKKIIAHILRENSEPSQVHLLEQSKDSVKFRARLQDYTESRNKTIYSKEVLTDALNDAHILELKSTNNWFGEAGHPYKKDDTLRQLAILHSNASHKILQTFILEEGVDGIIRTAHSNMGRFMRDEILDGTKVAFSMRGFGPHKIDSLGRKIVTRLKILTYDWVLYPSFKSAYMTNFLNENTQYNFLNESYSIPLFDSDLQYAMRESENFNSLQENWNFGDEDIMVEIRNEGKDFILRTKKSEIKLILDREFLYNEDYHDFVNSTFNK